MTDETRVGVLAFEGVEELDAVGPYDVFGAAAQRGADWTVELLATAPTGRVTGSKGLRVEPDGVLDAGDPPEFLVVPGGGWNDRAETGAWAAAHDEELCETLRAVHADGTTLLAVCTGAMVLATAGLLDGRPAVTHAGAVDELAETADVVEADAGATGTWQGRPRVVDDGDVVTSGGVTAGIDLALWVVEREWGAAVADAVATELEHERADVFRPNG